MNHLQMIVLIGAFDFRWPDIVSRFLDSPKPVGAASEQIISLDCILDGRMEAD